MQYHHIPKKLSTKQSLKNIKPNKKVQKNQSTLITSARTPRSGQFMIDLKKSPLYQFKTIKSIPTITYREVYSTLFPSEVIDSQYNLSYLNFNNTEYKAEYSETGYTKVVKIKRLLSDRRMEKSRSSAKGKESPFIKNKNDEKTKRKKYTNNNTKKTSKQRRNTTLNVGHFSPYTSYRVYLSKGALYRLLKRTNQVLLKYQTRYYQWKKYKLSLLKYIYKYKKKPNGKSNTTASSTHNIINKLVV